MAKQSRPKDVNQLAKSILDIATGETEDTVKPDDGKNPAAVALGRLGGKVGGKARGKPPSNSILPMNKAANIFADKSLYAIQRWY